MEDFAQVDYTFRMERMFDFQKVDTNPQVFNENRLTSDLLRRLDVFTVEEKISFALDLKEPETISICDSEKQSDEVSKPSDL